MVGHFLCELGTCIYSMSAISGILCNRFIQTSMGPVLDQTGQLELARSGCQHEEGPTKRSCPHGLTSRTIRDAVDYILGECVLTPGAI